jgi:hypothetical protein
MGIAKQHFVEFNRPVKSVRTDFKTAALSGSAVPIKGTRDGARWQTTRGR